MPATIVPVAFHVHPEPKRSIFVEEILLPSINQPTCRRSSCRGATRTRRSGCRSASSAGTC